MYQEIFAIFSLDKFKTLANIEDAKLFLNLTLVFIFMVTIIKWSSFVLGGQLRGAFNSTAAHSVQMKWQHFS